MTNIQEYFQLYPKEQTLLQVGEMVFLEKNRHQAEEYATANQLKVEVVKRPAPKTEDTEEPKKPAAKK